MLVWTIMRGILLLYPIAPLAIMLRVGEVCLVWITLLSPCRLQTEMRPSFGPKQKCDSSCRSIYLMHHCSLAIHCWDVKGSLRKSWLASSPHCNNWQSAVTADIGECVTVCHCCMNVGDDDMEWTLEDILMRCLGIICVWHLEPSLYALCHSFYHFLHTLSMTDTLCPTWPAISWMETLHSHAGNATSVKVVNVTVWS